MSVLNPPPLDKIGETPGWRQWFWSLYKNQSSTVVGIPGATGNTGATGSSPTPAYGDVSINSSLVNLTTSGTYYILPITSVSLNQFTVSSNALVCGVTGSQQYGITFFIDYSASSSGNFAIYKNGSGGTQIVSNFHTTGNYGQALTGTVSLTSGDTISVWATSIYNSQTITPSSGRLVIYRLG